MKAKIIALTLAAAGISAALRADPQLLSEFDFGRINAAISEAMTPIVAKSNIFSRFTYLIDESETNIDQDRYAVEMQVVGKEPWSDGTFTSNIGLTLQYGGDANPNKLKLAYDLDVDTDTLAFIRHHAQKSRVCETRNRAWGVLRISLAEDCKVLPRLTNVTSFDDLFSILRDHIDSAKSAVLAYRSELQKAASAVSGDMAVDSLGAQLAEVDRYLTGVSQVQLNRTEDGVSLIIPDFPVIGIVDMRDIEFDFSPAKMRGRGNVAIDMSSKIYDAFKPELIQILRDLERGEDYPKTLIQMETRFWLRLMEGHVQSQDD
jgi:hypothetical protein